MPSRLAAQAASPDNNPAATEEMTRLVQFIGTYVVVFQDIEAKLDQIIGLAVGLDRWHIGHAVVSLLSNAQKIDLVQGMVQSSAISDEDPFRTDWLASFDKVIQPAIETEPGVTRRVWCYEMPLLDECRAAFDELLGPALSPGEGGRAKHW